MNEQPSYPNKFSRMVDEMVDLAIYNDQELFEGIQWCDGQAYKKGISFYDMVFEILYRHDVTKKAKDWLRYRN